MTDILARLADRTDKRTGEKRATSYLPNWVIRLLDDAAIEIRRLREHRPSPMQPLPDEPSESCEAFNGKPCIVGGWNDGTWASGEAYYNTEREGWWWAQTHETDATDGRVHFKLEYWMPLPGAPAKEPT